MVIWLPKEETYLPHQAGNYTRKQQCLAEVLHADFPYHSAFEYHVDQCHSGLETEERVFIRECIKGSL